MLFNSQVFLFAFLPLAYVGFWRLRTAQQRYYWLTFTGYLFYSFWNAKFCALMAFSTVVSYLAGLGFLRWSTPGYRKLCLVLPLTTDLLLLGFFKYANFALGSAQSAAGWLGLPFHAPFLDIVLPIGISFYTFHTISYIVDAYRGTIVPTRNFFEFSCYVSLFSQLVAGPIVRFRQIENDLEKIGSADWKTSLNEGWGFFAVGMVKKVLIADTIAMFIAPWLHKGAHLSTGTAWLCVLGYAYQLYFDFSGYSDMAVGLGYMFGLRLPQNFNSPYKAVNIAEFWRRWHISLSSCLRDYLYIPLGGGRGTKLMVNRNLLLTMLIGGLWHGANWTFVIWGAYHGLLLVAHRHWASAWEKMPDVAQRAATFFLVLIGWVFFRADSLEMAGGLLRSMFVWTNSRLAQPGLGLVALLLLAAGLAHLARNSFQMNFRRSSFAAVGLAVLFGFSIFLIFGGETSPFLYFQF